MEEGQKGPVVSGISTRMGGEVRGRLAILRRALQAMRSFGCVCVCPHLFGYVLEIHREKSEGLRNKLVITVSLERERRLGLGLWSDFTFVCKYLVMGDIAIVVCGIQS